MGKPKLSTVCWNQTPAHRVVAWIAGFYGNPMPKPEQVVVIDPSKADPLGFAKTVIQAVESGPAAVAVRSPGKGATIVWAGSPHYEVGDRVL